MTILLTKSLHIFISNTDCLLNNKLNNKFNFTFPILLALIICYSLAAFFIMSTKITILKAAYKYLSKFIINSMIFYLKNILIQNI